MFAKIKHLAIVSGNHELEGEFYASLFGMKTAPRSRPAGAVVVGDGYLGLNINPRAPGRQAGLDHFGFEVEDVERVFARLHESYPSIQVLKRPGNRPFAGISTHDPAGNVFDLSQQGMENRRGVYVDKEEGHVRYVKHFTLRAVNPALLAKFYREVFELVDLEKPADDPNSYLSDGRVTLAIQPWKITDFDGTGIERPALDHIGFKVESVGAFKKDRAALVEKNPAFAPQSGQMPPEREARLKLFQKCRFGDFQLSDPDGVLIDVSER